MDRRAAIGLVFSASLTVAVALPAAADEVRQGLNAPMILQMLSRPVEKPESAMREMLRADAVQANSVRSGQPQMMPDGSARYGTDATSVSMMIRNPCPPGDLAHEAMIQRSLPGRGRK